MLLQHVYDWQPRQRLTDRQMQANNEHRQAVGAIGVHGGAALKRNLRLEECFPKKIFATNPNSVRAAGVIVLAWLASRVKRIRSTRHHATLVLAESRDAITENPLG